MAVIRKNPEDFGVRRVLMMTMEVAVILVKISSLSKSKSQKKYIILYHITYIMLYLWCLGKYNWSNGRSNITILPFGASCSEITRNYTVTGQFRKVFETITDFCYPHTTFFYFIFENLKRTD